MRRIAVFFLLALVLAGTPAGAATGVPVLVVDGAGFGHGVGMAQDGAYWMGRSGASRDAILGLFYPGVSIGRGSGIVRVAVLTDDDADVVLTFSQGGQVRSDAPGFPIDVPPGGAVRVRHDSRYRVEPAGPVRAAQAGPAQVLPLPGPPSTTTTTSLVSPPTTPPTTPPTAPPTTASTPAPPPTVRDSDRSVWATPAPGGTIGVPDRNARYRGEIEATAGSGPLRLIDQVDVEDYLRGMGEVRDPSWPAASLQAQAVVARTYALRAMRASGELCDSQRCQVYLGQQAEYPAMDRAVRATAGMVLTYGGGFAAAVYSANGAGRSATPAEGFGTPDSSYPYLRSVPYETKSPDPWQVRIALTDVAARLRYPGALTAVTVATTGPSGRPTSVALDGDAGRRVVPASALAAAAALRSTSWRLTTEVADAPVVAPAPAELIQSLPDEVSTAAPLLRQPRQRPATAEPSAGRGRPWWLLATLLLATLLPAVVLLARRSPALRPGSRRRSQEGAD